MQCPLCHSHSLKTLKHQQVSGEQFLCQICDLIFKSPDLYLNWSEQKSRYDHHQNQMENPGYVDFFEQLLEPLRPYLPLHQKALDWGAGPGEKPVLAELLKKEGLKVETYDPIYQPEPPQGLYEVITSTEVFEHFQGPRECIEKILLHLTSGGILAGLTQFHQGPQHFEKWWYVKDPTHVVFYSEKTFKWIGQQWGLEVLFLDNPVFIFRKSWN
ncbi:MAG: class I SAM-dependent methyltransferase [Pseudobdellovibrionaceae bacterium]